MFGWNDRDKSRRSDMKMNDIMQVWMIAWGVCIEIFEWITNICELMMVHWL